VEITREFLQHGSHVEVLEPGWLREKVEQELKAAITHCSQYCYHRPFHPGLTPEKYGI
jgi:hypothetical protein